MDTARRSKSRRASIIVVLLALVYLCAELVAFVGLRVLDSMGKAGYAPTLTSDVADEHREILTRVVNGEAEYIGYSQQLGWTTLPYGRNEIYEANSQGVRGTREYATAAPHGTLRIAAFGDSYVHGDDVPNDVAWSIVAERKDPAVEVLNFGVGGYGPDQAYLRYLYEGVKLAPHVVFIGYQTENINRVVNVYRPFYSPTSGNPLSKPYFRLSEAGDLILHKNPIQSLSAYEELLADPAPMLRTMGEDDFHYRYRYSKGLLDFSPSMRLAKVFLFEYRSRFLNPIYEDSQLRTDSDAYRILVSVLQKFHCDVVANGSLPIVILFPNRADLAALQDGEPLQYHPLRKQLETSGYQLIDLKTAFEPALRANGLNDVIEAHYTAKGNEIVADFILASLREKGIHGAETRTALIDSLARLCP